MANNISEADMTRYVARVSYDLSITGMNESDRRALARHILEWPGKRLNFDQLVPSSLKPVCDSRRAAQVVSVCLANGLLVPQKRTSFVWAGSQKVPKRYIVLAENLKKTDRKVIKSGVEKLDRRITAREPNYLVLHPKVFDSYREQFELLSRWLGTSRRQSSPATLRERSYEIWGDEKTLQLRAPGMKDQFGFVLTKFLRIDLFRLLKIDFDSEENFESYILPGGGSVVVSENLDMYLDLRKLLQDKGPFILCGEAIRGAVFGEGQRVTEPEFKRFLNSSSLVGTDILYIGDIDRAGLCILDYLRTNLGIRSFKGIYSMMAIAHMNRRAAGLPINSYGDIQPQTVDMTNLSDAFDPWAMFEIARCMNKSVRIPQEILKKSDLEKAIGPQVDESSCQSSNF